MEAEHTFSHIQWELDVYKCKFIDQRIDAAGSDEERMGADETAEAAGSGAGAGVATGLSGAGDLAQGYKWISVADMERYAFPNVFLRIISEIHNSRK
jgi:A/G-specific adenine glycosylase